MFGLHLGSSDLMIREAELLATHHFIPGSRSGLHWHTEGLGFPESP